MPRLISQLQRVTLSTKPDIEVMPERDFYMPCDGWMIELEAWQIHKAKDKQDEIPVILRLTSCDIPIDMQFVIPYPHTETIVVVHGNIEDLFRTKLLLRIPLRTGMKIRLYASVPLVVETAPILLLKATFSDERP